MYFSIHTLGCKVNQYESDAIAAVMEQNGFVRADTSDDAEVVVLNSCTVTEKSSEKTEQEIRKLRAAHPTALVVLIGCFPEAYPERAGALPADIVTGNRNGLPQRIKAHLQRQESLDAFSLPTEYEELGAFAVGRNTRAYLKIEDGCDRHCAYCIIPTARGAVRSRKLSSIREEAQKLADNGTKEIVLVGINLSCYGQDIGLSLSDAVEQVASVRGVERVRLSSLEPELLTPDVLQRLQATKKLCPHFHLSLQSGCDRTLSAMNRHYTTSQYEGIVNNIRGLFPNAAITTDIMVGFPGESDEDFQESYRFAEHIGFSKMHVFTYSVREGTVAASMEQVDEKIKTARYREMAELAKKLQHQFFESQIGTEQTVIIERRTSPDFLMGHTENYTPVRIFGSDAERQQLLTVRITKAENAYCIGIEGNF